MRKPTNSSITAYPLCWPTGRPRTTTRTNNAHLKGTFDAGRKRLSHELELLRATDIILSTNVELRLDGQPRATAIWGLQDPGVAVYFKLKGRDVVMDRDAFLKVEQNLQSLALVINHMRGLERHGGAHVMDRAFTGFIALPAPTKRHWHDVFYFHPDGTPPTEEEVKLRFKEQAAKKHPDKGGTQADFEELVQARDEGLAAISRGEYWK